MPVYIARFGALGPVKIGFSNHVQQRLNSIQSQLWDEFTLLRLLDGTGADERALHRRFASLRIKQEWFTYSAEMMGDLGLRDLLNDPAQALARFSHWSPAEAQSARATALREWMVEAGLYEHNVAKLLKCSPWSVVDWLKNGSRPRDATVRKLIALSGGALENAFGGQTPAIGGGAG